MRRLRIALFSCLAVVLLAACDTGWIQPLAGPDHASYNAGENVLTLANVTTLQQAFHTSGVVGTPVASQGVLVVGSGSTVTGFDATTGAQKWQATLPDQINGGPFIDGNQVRVSYPGSGSSFEQNIDLFGGLNAATPPVPTMGAMVARRGDNSVRLNTVFQTGEGTVDFVQISGKALDGQVGAFGDTFTLGPKYLYVTVPGPGTFSGTILAYDPDRACGSNDNCTPVWSRDMNELVAAPAIDPDGTLYLGANPASNSGDRSLTALDGSTGSVKWADVYGSGTPPLAGTPAVANGVVYSQTNDPATFQSGFVALSAADGHLLWTATTPVASPTVAGGVVYGTNGSEVVAYNANGCGQATCAPIWTASLGTDTPSGGLAVTGGMLYVGTNTGVTAFKPTS